MSDPQREPSLSLQEYNNKALASPVKVFLPASLTSKEFLNLLEAGSSSSKKPAYGFPAFQSWFSKLLKSFNDQDNEAHPFHKHPYQLREIDVQAVDWFWRNRPGHEDKLGFMKIQSKIQTAAYTHDGEKKSRADWLPGAVFLRGGSVAVLVRSFIHLSIPKIHLLHEHHPSTHN